jgi:hypothetical protein
MQRDIIFLSHLGIEVVCSLFGYANLAFAFMLLPVERLFLLGGIVVLVLLRLVVLKILPHHLAAMDYI